MSEYDEYREAHHRKQNPPKHRAGGSGGSGESKSCGEMVAIPVTLALAALLLRTVAGIRRAGRSGR